MQQPKDGRRSGVRYYWDPKAWNALQLLPLVVLVASTITLLCFIFLHNTYYHLLSLLFIVCHHVHSIKARIFVFCSLLYPQGLEHHRINFSICWMNKSPFLLWQVFRTSLLPYTQDTNVMSAGVIIKYRQGQGRGWSPKKVHWRPSVISLPPSQVDRSFFWPRLHILSLLYSYRELSDQSKFSARYRLIKQLIIHSFRRQ